MVQDYDPEEPGDSGGIFGGRPPLPIIGGIVAAVVIGIILVVVVLGSGGGGNGENANARPTLTATAGTRTAQSGGLVTGVPSPQATLDLSRATVTAAPNLSSVGASDRMVIPKFSINAPLTFRTVGADGIMPNPDGPDDVAYYNFSSWPGLGGAPGQGGNSVFAGHVDSGFKACDNGSVPPPCEAVFWDVSRLSVGDKIEIHLNGQVFTYSVTSNQAVDANSAPWDQIVAATAQETITLITCGGDFNTQTHEYNHRQVVVAVRS
jgi:LPXTG-site transpeptidase (sortase) family protein